MPYPFWQLEDQLIPTLTTLSCICKCGFFGEAVEVTQVSSQKAALRPGLGPQPSGDSTAGSRSEGKLRPPLQLTPPSAQAREATTTGFDERSEAVPDTRDIAQMLFEKNLWARGGGFSCPLSRHGRPPVAGCPLSLPGADTPADSVPGPAACCYLRCAARVSPCPGPPAGRGSTGAVQEQFRSSAGAVQGQCRGRRGGQPLARRPLPAPPASPRAGGAQPAAAARRGHFPEVSTS